MLLVIGAAVGIALGVPSNGNGDVLTCNTNEVEYNGQCKSCPAN